MMTQAAAKGGFRPPGPVRPGLVGPGGPMPSHAAHMQFMQKMQMMQQMMRAGAARNMEVRRLMHARMMRQYQVMQAYQMQMQMQHAQAMNEAWYMQAMQEMQSFYEGWEEGEDYDEDYEEEEEEWEEEEDDGSLPETPEELEARIQKVLAAAMKRSQAKAEAAPSPKGASTSSAREQKFGADDAGHLESKIAEALQGAAARSKKE